MDERKPPVKEGDVLKLPCMKEGKKDNDGIFREEGFIIIVPDANIVGEEYKIRIIKVLDTMAFGELVNEG